MWTRMLTQPWTSSCNETKGSCKSSTLHKSLRGSPHFVSEETLGKIKLLSNSYVLPLPKLNRNSEGAWVQGELEVFILTNVFTRTYAPTAVITRSDSIAGITACTCFCGSDSIAGITACTCFCSFCPPLTQSRCQLSPLQSRLTQLAPPRPIQTREVTVVKSPSTRSTPSSGNGFRHFRSLMLATRHHAPYRT